MNIKYFIFFILVINIFTFSQSQEINCNSSFTTNVIDLTQRGGKYITASGDLKVLVVFAKFKDDTASHPFWPADSYPSEMNDLIDPDILKGSTHFLNLTNYYNQMSFEKFRVIGKTIGAETPYAIGHYIYNDGKYPDRSQATRDLLQSIDDSIDYNEFDNWTYLSDYNHINEPDGIVDMIIVIWRGLVFSDQWSGDSCLGGGLEFWVENNQKRIRMCYGGNPTYGIDGSGVTVQYWGERSRERNFKVIIHEMAHWLIQIEHPYSYFIHTFWGMLTLGGEGICANTFEREKLTWLNPISIDSTILNAPMGDFITTPSAYKFHPTNGYPGETFYFENHQKISIYDNGTTNPDDKGIFILHLANDSYVGDCVRILTSDGFWNWDVPFNTDCWGNVLPAFQKKSINRDGFGNRDKITSINSCCGFLYSYINQLGKVECNDWLHGYGFNNSFDTTFNNVFSQWSNPPAKSCNGQSTDFIMEVNNQVGSIVNISFAVKNALEGSPSKPALGKDPRTLDSENESEIIKLVWGSDFWDGFQIEPDVNWSELQMKVGTEGWSTIYTGANRFWNDSDYVYESDSNFSVSFRVSVRDSQNKWSIWSDVYETIKIINNVTSINDRNEEQLKEFQLSQNYPNPFNPSTKISWRSPIGSWQTLKIYDLLGNEVAMLVDEYKPAGKYETEFDAAVLPSGVYFYRLQAGSFVETKKMILLK